MTNLSVNGHVDSIWRERPGDGPLIATAVHDGHAARDEVAALFAIDDAARLREEDPFTRQWVDVAPTTIVGLRSRFEVDLNRPRDKAVYRKPEDAWGLHVWKHDPPEEVVGRSLAEYDRFYEAMRQLLKRTEQQHRLFVVYDLHSYNHRREGPDGPEADAEGNPQVNIGTGTMDRARWAPVVDRLIHDLREFDFPGGKLDVRENVKFQGGQWSRWIGETFPQSGIPIAIEFKKFFMDEWTGRPNLEIVDAIGKALDSTVPGVLSVLEELQSSRRS